MKENVNITFTFITVWVIFKIKELEVAIIKFRDENRFLSNFWPCQVLFEDIVYPSSEHAYQAIKSLDKHVRLEIASLRTAGDAKRRGYKITLRPDWEDVKIRKMYQICLAKFTQNSHLKDKLLKTYTTELIEGNTWHDNFWGDCSCEKCKNIKGQNNLGKILMYIRDNLQLEDF